MPWADESFAPKPRLSMDAVIAALEALNVFEETERLTPTLVTLNRPGVEVMLTLPRGRKSPEALLSYRPDADREVIDRARTAIVELGMKPQPS